MILLQSKELPIDCSESQLKEMLEIASSECVNYLGAREINTVSNADEVEFSNHNGLYIATFYNPSHNGDNTCQMVLNNFNGHKIGQFVG